MSLLVIGLNHTTASVAVRERFAISEERIISTAQSLIESEGDEAFVLSTCNRVEFYISGNDLDALMKRAKSHLGQLGQVSVRSLDEHCYVKRGTDAISHLFRVAASLDSMVIGEPQILGQLKAAVQQARLGETIGSRLTLLTDRAFTTAKKSEAKLGSESLRYRSAV